MIQQFKPIPVYFPIQRVDDEKREVTGIAFANEIVRGEGGIRLRTKTMEKATPDYEKWGCIRAMHQPIAAGKLAQPVKWDNGRATIVARVEDDTEWNKVKKGIYQGFSVLVTADEMKGNDVTRCTWIETSLVDRPKDPDATFSLIRGEGIPEQPAAKTFPCDVKGGKEGKSVKRSKDDLNIPAVTGQGELIQRVAACETAATAITRALENLPQVLSRIGDLDKIVRVQAKEIKRMKKEAANLPRMTTAPVRYTENVRSDGLIERNIVTGESPFASVGDDPRIGSTLEKYNAIVANPPDPAKSTPEQRVAAAIEIDSLRSQLAGMGVQV